MPLSPVIITRASVPATMCACASRSSMIALRVMISLRQSSVVSAKPETLSAFCTWSSSSCLSTGLVRNANAPLCVACTASGIVPCAVRMMTCSPGRATLHFLQQADAVHLVHAQIGDHQIRTDAAERGERQRGAFDGVDFVVLRAQTDREQPQQPRIVVNDQ